MGIMIESVNYSRNGISGAGFLQVRFCLNDFEYGDTPLLAVIPAHTRDRDEVPSRDGYGPSGAVECYVVNLSDPFDNLRGDVMYRKLMDAGVWDELAERHAELAERRAELLGPFQN